MDDKPYKTTQAERDGVQRYQDRLLAEGKCIRCRVVHGRQTWLCVDCTVKRRKVQPVADNWGDDEDPASW